MMIREIPGEDKRADCPNMYQKGVVNQEAIESCIDVTQTCSSVIPSVFSFITLDINQV